MMNTIRSSVLLPIFVALLAGCSDGATGVAGPGQDSAGRVASITISPGAVSLEVGASAPFQATPLDVSGSPLSGRAVTWTSSDTTVVTVSSNGLVSARGAGTAIIRASSDGKSAGVAVVVADRTIAWIVITPAGGMIPQDPGTSRQLAVVAKALDGTEITGRSIAWSSSDPTVATVSASGLLQAHSSGNAMITAEVGGKRDSTVVHVRSLIDRLQVDVSELALRLGDFYQLKAYAMDENGVPLQRAFSWSSSNSAVATVDAQGRVLASGAGVALITVTSEAKSATVRLVVTGQLLRLSQAGGAPLPAILYTIPAAENGASENTDFQLTRGTLRLYDNRYELRLEGWLLASGAAPVPHSHSSDGVLAYDTSTGAPMFHESVEWWNREPRFRGRARADGAVELEWNRAPGAPITPLVFAR